MSAGAVVRIDTHVHTRDSFDSTETVENVLSNAADAGLDGVVVTDHDEVSNSRRAADLAPEYGLLGIPGIELSTADGHLLGIGTEERPPVARSFERSVAAIRDAGGLAVVPHPFQRTRHGVSRGAIADCDGVEVFNAHALFGLRNRQADRFAARQGYPRFAGSDAHRAESVGRAYTEVHVGSANPSREAVLEAMRAGRTRVRGESLSTSRTVGKLAANARRNSVRILRVE